MRQLVDRGQLPGPGPDRKYELTGVVDAWTKYKVGLAIEAAPPPSDEDQRERYDRLRADLLEMELNEKRKLTTATERFDQMFSSACDRVAAKVKSLSNRLAPAVVGTPTVQDALARIEPLVREVWEELAQGDDIPDEDAA